MSELQFADRSMVNLGLWNLLITIVSLDLTYRVSIITLASTVFKKSTFHFFPLFKCIRKQI